MLNLRRLFKTALTLVVLFSLAIACSGDKSGPRPPAIDVGGDWSGTWSSTSSDADGTLALHLIDQSGSLSGDITVTGSPCLSQTDLTGRVSGLDVSLTAADATDDMELSATVQENDSDTMEGTYRVVVGDCQGDTGTFRLTREPGSGNGSPDAGGPFVIPNGGAGGAGGAGGMSGNGGNGGAAGGAAALATLGGECDSADDCELGLGCMGAEGGDWYGAGPSNGYCAVSCANDPTVCDAYPGSLCVLGETAAEAFCLEGCTRGAAVVLEEKCHGRPDVACSELAVGVAACLPTCGSDSQCPAGRYCDVLTGGCVDAEPQGDEVGAACDPSATINTCRGGCLDLGGGYGACSGACTLGLDYPACGSDPTATNWAGAPVCWPLSDIDAVNDLSVCLQLCDSAQDCSHPGAQCEPFDDAATEAALRSLGLCTPAPEVPATDGGVEPGDLDAGIDGGDGDLDAGGGDAG